MAKRKSNLAKKDNSLQRELIVMPLGEKVFDPAVAEQSVVKTPDVRENASPQTSLLFMVASVADTLIPWGVNVPGRDKQLRDFFPTEPLLASATYSVCARDASFAWDVVSADKRKDPRYTISAVKRMLNNVGNGKGWGRFMMKTCVDLYTQDNGFFWEKIRMDKDNPNSPVVSLSNLDAARCTRTGDPRYPVLYQDRYGRYHKMAAHQVVVGEEQPSAVEEMFDVQYCAVTRAMRLSQIAKSMFLYKDEKVSGRNPRAIDFISGTNQTQVKDAMRLAEETQNNAGFARYSSHILVAGIDPTNPMSHVRVDLASLPDNFDFDSEMKWYVAILAMAFGVDYQEFAPLPSGALGSGAQSEILHLKTHGKGPATVMSLFEHILNNDGILPATVQFVYKDHDAKAETQKADAAYTRALDRALRVQSGELDPIAAQQLAQEHGDLPKYIAEGLEERGVGDIAAPIENPAAPTPNNEDEEDQGDENPMNAGPDQIEGAQQGRLGRREQLSGGMGGIKPATTPPEVSVADVERERRAMRERLVDA